MGKTLLMHRPYGFMAYDGCMSNGPTTPSLPSYEMALARVLEQIKPLEPEPLPLSGALGCVLAEPIMADRDQPPFNRSMMDGFAVRSTEVCEGAAFDVVTTIAAGAVPGAGADMARGVAAIATGASLPDSYDAVIPIEQADEQAGRVRFTVDHVRPGTNIHPRGSDAQAGCVLIRPGTVLRPQHIGIAAAVGCVQPVVVRRPCVSLITTGDEVQPPATVSAHLTPQQIRNANGPLLDALQQSLGVERLDHVHVKDDQESTLSVLREATDKSDLVITVGGVSAGTRDYLPWAAGELGFKSIVKGAAIQPGKPIFIAQEEGEHGAILVGLPGNPVSVLATAHLFAWPIIRILSGIGSGLPWRDVVLTEAVKPNPNREAFRCAELIGEGHNRVRVIGWQNSGDLTHTSTADGFVRLPIQQELIESGEMVPFLPMIGPTL